MSVLLELSGLKGQRGRSASRSRHEGLRHSWHRSVDPSGTITDLSWQSQSSLAIHTEIYQGAKYPFISSSTSVGKFA